MRWLVFTTMVFLAATCGQKGPLSRPDPETSASIALLLLARTPCSAVEHQCSHSNQPLQQQ